jgi:hypothetical protein
MLAILLGIDSPSQMLAVVVALVLLMAAGLRERLSGRNSK